MKIEIIHNEDERGQLESDREPWELHAKVKDLEWVWKDTTLENVIRRCKEDITNKIISLRNVDALFCKMGDIEGINRIEIELERWGDMAILLKNHRHQEGYCDTNARLRIV